MADEHFVVKTNHSRTLLVRLVLGNGRWEGMVCPARREWCPAVWRDVCDLPGGIKVGASCVEVYMLCPESGQRC